MSTSPLSRPAGIRAAAWLLAALLSTPCATVLAQPDPLAGVHELMSRGLYDQALQALDTLIGASPDDAEARFLRGVIHVQQGERDRAMAIFRGLTEQFPDLPEPYNNLAVLHASRGDYEQARELLLEAIELQPGYDTAFENLGDVHAKLAAIAYERAYRLNQRNRRAHSKSGVLAEMLSSTAGRDDPVAVTAEVGPESAHPWRPQAGPGPADEAGAARRCYRSEPLDDAQRAAEMVAWLQEQGAEAAVREDEAPDPATRYRVYLPPAADRDSAVERIRSLREAGLRDMMIISGGSLNNGVSLGVFSKPASVKRRLSQLRALGVEATVDPPLPGPGVRVVRATIPAGAALEPGQFSQRFGGSELGSVACGK